MSVKPGKQENAKSRSPEQISPKEALKRMKSFGGRKEKFIASIKKSKN